MQPGERSRMTRSGASPGPRGEDHHRVSSRSPARPRYWWAFCGERSNVVAHNTPVKVMIAVRPPRFLTWAQTSGLQNFVRSIFPY